MNALKNSELVLAPDGSLYHIRLTDEHIADNVLLVGDPARVDIIASFFEKIEFRKENREIRSCTGYFNSQRITVLSTGMGTDNIDIVINELDAAVNIDLATRQVKENHRKLNLIRLGTCGALQADIPVESFIASESAIGLDGLLNFYKADSELFRNDISVAFIKHTLWSEKLPYPYVAEASPILLDKIAGGLFRGITATAPGFYGPQGRRLRIEPNVPDTEQYLSTFSFNGARILNFEMETSAIYGLSKLLGHEALTVCLAVANRINGIFVSDYHPAMNRMIEHVLQRLATSI